MMLRTRVLYSSQGYLHTLISHGAQVHELLCALYFTHDNGICAHESQSTWYPVPTEIHCICAVWEQLLEGNTEAFLSEGCQDDFQEIQ